MANFRVTLEYDGEAFAGWQVQPRVRTVQGVLEEALAGITGSPARVSGAGRTDAGVHAEGQVASVRLTTRLDAPTLRRALNGVLPTDLAVLSAERVPDAFHARRDARSKLYRYRIWNGPGPSPLRRDRSLRVESPLDLPAMREAARALLGRHDFASFQAARAQVKSSVRSLTRCDVVEVSPGDISVWVQGDGFLRHMVRIVAGTLVEVGLGRRAAESMSAVLAARDRTSAGRTAPGRALTLVRVTY